MLAGLGLQEDTYRRRTLWCAHTKQKPITLEDIYLCFHHVTTDKRRPGEESNWGGIELAHHPTLPTYKEENLRRKT